MTSKPTKKSTTCTCRRNAQDLEAKRRLQLDGDIPGVTSQNKIKMNQGGRRYPTLGRTENGSWTEKSQVSSHEIGTKINCVWRQQIPGHGRKGGNFTKNPNKKRCQRERELICLKNDGRTGCAIPRDAEVREKS